MTARINEAKAAPALFEPLEARLLLDGGPVIQGIHALDHPSYRFIAGHGDSRWDAVNVNFEASIEGDVDEVTFKLADLEREGTLASDGHWRARFNMSEAGFGDDMLEVIARDSDGDSDSMEHPVYLYDQPGWLDSPRTGYDHVHYQGGETYLFDDIEVTFWGEGVPLEMGNTSIPAGFHSPADWEWTLPGMQDPIFSLANKWTGFDVTSTFDLELQRFGVTDVMDFSFDLKGSLLGWEFLDNELLPTGARHQVSLGRFGSATIGGDFEPAFDEDLTLSGVAGEFFIDPVINFDIPLGEYHIPTLPVPCLLDVVLRPQVGFDIEKPAGAEHFLSFKPVFGANGLYLEEVELDCLLEPNFSIEGGVSAVAGVAKATLDLQASIEQEIYLSWERGVGGQPTITKDAPGHFSLALRANYSGGWGLVEGSCDLWNCDFGSWNFYGNEAASSPDTDHEPGDKLEVGTSQLNATFDWGVDAGTTDRIEFALPGLSADDAEVRVTPNVSGGLDVNLFDAQNNTVGAKSIEGDTIIFDVGDFAPGFYCLQLQNVLNEDVPYTLEFDIDIEGGYVDVVEVIDRSGSMGGSEIVDARNAAKLFVDLMNTGDKVGVVSYSSSASTNYALTEITGVGTKNAAKSAISGISASGMTSIGAGIQAGDNQLDRFPSDPNRAMLVMTDGHENESPWAMDVVNGRVDSDIRIYTIGFGSGARESLLQQIAGARNGDYYYAPSGDQLREIYRDLAGALTGQQQAHSSSGVIQAGQQTSQTVNIDGSVSQAKFVVDWPGSDIDMALLAPDGTVIDHAAAGTYPNVELVIGDTYEAYTIDQPLPGDWEMILSGVTIPAGGEAYNTTVMASTPIEISVDTDQAAYSTGELVHITAELDDGMGIPGADVVATIAAPSGAAADGDRVRLYDDGLHGDGAAGDGMYANDFRRLCWTGTYDITVEGEGLSNAGVPFVRVGSRQITASAGTDSDGDGIPNVWENREGTDPNVSDGGDDLEPDLLTNLEEYYAGTRPTVADTDGDGYPDGIETWADTNPLDAASPPSDSFLVVATGDSARYEGDTFTGTALFADPAGSNWTATVDYGDGAPPDVLALDTVQPIPLNHLYADDGDFAVTVSMENELGMVAEDEVPVLVHNVAPSMGGGLRQSVYSNNFDDAPTVAPGVSASLTMNGSLVGVEGYAGLGTGGNTFAGRFLRNDSPGNPAAKTTLTLSDLPAHTSVDLDFLAAMIDSWDGERGPDFFNVEVDGRLIFSETFDWTSQNEQSYVAPPGGQLTTRPLSQLGFSPQWPDAAYDLGLDAVFENIPHNSSTLTISWYASGSGWQAGNDESWAIENLDVALNNIGSGQGHVDLDTHLIDEGDSVTLSGVFVDPGTEDTHEVAIDWGDGQYETVALPMGARTFSVSHRYLDDGPSETDSYDYPVHVVVNDDDGGTATGVPPVSSIAGPNTFGYQAYDYLYEDTDLVAGAPGVAVVLDGTDDGYASVALDGNEFTFYGDSYDLLYVNPNGLITFGAGAYNYSNTDLSSVPDQAAIGPLFDDWRTDRGGGDAVLSRFDDLDGDGTSDRLILEWNNVQHYSSSPSGVTFQAILELNTGALPGDIALNYLDLDAGTTSYNDGASATIGIKDANGYGSDPLVVSVNSTGPHVATGEAVLFSTRPTVSGRTVTVNNVAPTVTELAQDKTEVNEGEAVTVNVTFEDPGELDTHEVLVDWGDGDGRVFDLPVGMRTFTLVHRYHDDRPSGTSQDESPFSVRIWDDDGGDDARAGDTPITVHNVSPTVELDPVAAIEEGEAATLTGTIVDPGTDQSTPGIHSLARVDEMIAGTLPSTTATGTIGEADLKDNDVPGRWAFDNWVPGGGGEDYAIVGTSTLRVNTAGTFSFAIGGDDGGRLRIDGQDVIIDDSTHGFQQRYGDIFLDNGDHTFEWVGFQGEGRVGWELSVAPGAGNTSPVSAANGWKAVGDPSPHAEIRLLNPIEVTAYYAQHYRQLAVDNLATADAIISGRLQSQSLTGQVYETDLADQTIFRWGFDNGVPGGGGDDYAVVGTGTLQVHTGGTFSFALGGDDGGRLRIDGQDIIVDDATHGFENRFADVHLDAGEHTFEWTGFERLGGAGWELSVAPGAGNTGPVNTTNGWKVVGDPSPHPEIGLTGPIQVTAYYSAGANPTPVDSLSTVDAMISGQLPSEPHTGQIDEADLADVVSGSWAYDNAVPGGGGDHYAFVGTGTLEVGSEGVFSFALRGDDGGRVRIDGQEVIVDATHHGMRNSFGEIFLEAGDHALEWTAFENDGNAGWELSVAVGEGKRGPINAANGWKVLGDPSPFPEIGLVGPMDITVHYLDWAPTETFTVDVDWGDGTVEPVVVDAASRALTASHTYATAGDYAVGVAVNDDDGGQGFATTSVTVNPPGPTDVTSSVDFGCSRVAYDRRTRQYSMLVTVTNTSDMAITDPTLVIEGISSSSVTCANADGTTQDGRPCFELGSLLGDGTLDSGESVSVRVYFSNPLRQRFSCDFGCLGIL